MAGRPVPPVPEDPAVRENLEKILASPSTLRAHEDLAWLARDELRGTRLELELERAEAIISEAGVTGTIVVFGGTRVVEKPEALRRLAEAEAAAAAAPGDAEALRVVERARRVLAKARYYDEAREFARIASTTCLKNGRCDFVVVTGGGPGVMEAANRGAFDVGATSLGFNIVLPHEQFPNPYITPGLCIYFHYFATRKMHFLIRAKALVAFPGGYGTLDELFETLTLIQTRKMPPVPVVLFGREFWEKAIDLDYLVEEGTIAPEDARLVSYAETAAEAWEAIARFHGIG
ncbi:MAG TPA: TIGR00730 family Rossman fold protein [Thermoanaerobaculia bacterium]|nr:TIGR00730 family Rossman fold protein [Thermoanaerobaculia bacterium]